MIQRDMSFNHGAVVDMNIPTDRHIVGALVVLIDSEGEFSVYPSIERPKFGWPTSQPPSDEVLWELVANIRTAWELASLQTTEENE